MLGFNGVLRVNRPAVRGNRSLGANGQERPRTSKRREEDEKGKEIMKRKGKKKSRNYEMILQFKFNLISN